MLSSQLFPHRHELDSHTVSDFVLDSLASFITAGPVQLESGERCHQLNRPKAVSSCFALTSRKNRTPYPLSRILRVDEKCSNLCRLFFGVKLARISDRELVSAEKGSTLTPSAAADQGAGVIGNEIRTIQNQVCVNTEDGRGRSLNLSLRVIFPTQAPCRLHDKPFDCPPVIQTRFSYNVIHSTLRKTPDT